MAISTIQISSQDKARLLPLIDSARLDARIPQDGLSLLEREVGRATVRSPAGLPADVVRMNSWVTFVDLTTGETERYNLVYPTEADPRHDRISILAPIGTALLGYRVGDVIEWRVPAGTRRLQIMSVEMQEHAAGFHP